ncbi:hypothetical protein LMG9964_02189 [Paraburkholderia phenoliruptrix]|uniref:Uncharacterized protein n=1 Tax=Paraburkholderia phenoliruptrix TaxID=252970 RepID=A0A6J5K4K9_9BURK|nr:hypothetical protein LMG9964_02189 [Paraburkholderia phenoliruptrix]
MMTIDLSRCDAGTLTVYRCNASASCEGGSEGLSVCPVMPDFEEARMLQALVHEGAASARRAPFVAFFRGWGVRASSDCHCREACVAHVVVEICCQCGLPKPVCRFPLRLEARPW